MELYQPVVLTICYSEKIRQRVIERINKMDVIVSHLERDTFNKVSLATIRELDFDLIIFDYEFLKVNPVSKLRSLLPETRLLAVLGENGWPARMEYEFGSTLRHDAEDVAIIYKPDYCTTVDSLDGLVDYLLFTGNRVRTKYEQTDINHR